jgi:type IV pilus assembly protein PilW
MRATHTRQRGMSLVELMVALLIGVILTSGVISVYITSKTSYTMNMGLGQVQETGRFALQTLQPLMILGGNLGCKHPQPKDLTIDNKITNYAGEPVYDFRKPVYGFEYTGTGTGAYLSDSTGSISNSPTVDGTQTNYTPNLSAEVFRVIKTLAVKYSDVLMVHEMQTTTAAVTTTNTGVASVAYSSSNSPPVMAAGEILLASNCNDMWSAFDAGAVTTHTVVTNGSGTPGSTGNLTNNFSTYGGGSVGPMQTYVFFVGKSTIDGGTSLFQVKLETDNTNSKVGQLGAPVEVVPGVENMQVLYGVDTTTNLNSDGTETLTPDTYLTADNVTDWTRVVSVRVALVVHSDPNTVDAAPSSTTSFHMLGTGFTDSFSYKPYADRRMRRYFAETFSMRNNLP